MEDQVIIPSPAGSEGYLELARTRNIHGVKFRKHILNLGELIHPKTGERLQLGDDFYAKLQRNFADGVCDIVQVPLADAQNRHSEDPLRNTGEVVGIEREGSKVYSVLDIRDPKAVDGLRNKTLLGASAFLNLDYTDTRTGRKVGPALLHHCVTNRPYVTGLDDYEEVIAATADGEGDVIVLAQEEHMPATKEELLEQLKTEHGIDVAALQETAAAKGGLPELTAALTAALQGTPAADNLKLTGTEGTTVALTDVVGAIAELAQQHRGLSETVVKMTRERAEDEVQALVNVGRVLPKQKAGFVTLALTDRDTFDLMLPDEPVVKLNAQEGGPGAPQGEGQHVTDIDAELARLAGQGATARFFEPQK